jgi:hypothetical protein
MISSGEFAHLGVKTVFNKTLRHMVNVSSLIDSVDKGNNLAEILDTMEGEGVIVRQQIPPIFAVILISKFDYAYRSLNLEHSFTDFDKISKRFAQWSGVDMVIAYFHPNLGVIPINPSNDNHWQEVHELKKDELIVIYAKTVNKKRESAEKAIDSFISILNGQTPAEDPSFMEKRGGISGTPAQGGFITPPPRPAVAPSAPQPVAEAARQPVAATPAAAVMEGKPKQKNLTPKYSVQVTNELFHNGNVEAWKNIIESFEAKHSDCKVIVYHEGELIQDLNSLFKWGKVKHGGIIFFQIAGHNIKNVSRLQKYLFEGASKRFEAFLKRDVNKILNLF